MKWKMLFVCFIMSFLLCSCEKKAPPGFIDCNGRIEGDESKVGTKISGKVMELLVDEGSIVKKGQVLAKLSSEQIMASVKQAEANVDVAKKQLEKAKNNAKIQEANLRQAESNVEVAQAQYADAMEGVTIAASNINEASANKSYSVYQAKEASAGVDVSKAQLDVAKSNTTVSEKDISKSDLSLSQTRKQSDAQIKDAEAKVAAAKATLAQAQANYDYQRNEFDRNTNLYKEEVISKSAFDQAEASYKSALEQVNASQKQLESAEETLNYARTSAYTVSINEKQLETSYANFDSAKANEKSANVNVVSAKAKEASAYSMVDVYSAQYQTSLAQMGQAQAKAQEASLQVRVAEDNRRGALASYNAALDEVKSAEGSLKAYEAVLMSATADLEDTKIYAPSDGVILTKVSEPGEVLTPGGVVFTMVNYNLLYMKAYIPNELVGKIKLGDEARIYLDAYKDKYFEATVKEINQQAEFTPKNVETKAQRVKLVFGLKVYLKDNSKGEAKPGMPGDSRVKYDANARW